MPTELNRDIHSDNYLKYLNADGWVHSNTNKYIEIKSPYDESTIGFLPAMSAEEVDASIKMMPPLQNQWAARPAFERADIIRHAADILLERNDQFIDLINREVAKTREDAADEVTRTVDMLRYYADQSLRITGDTQTGDSYPNYRNKKIAINTRVPLGIVLAIPPFNYPVNEAAPKMISALLMGNACVLKASTQGGITNLHLARVLIDAGVPAGVLTVVTGKGSEIGDGIVSNPLIDCINFTGSYETALHISKVAGIKKMILGLSGKDASIVCADADIDKAVKEISSGSLSYSGQRCTGIKRIMVHESIYEEFLEKYLDAASKMEFGPVVDNKTGDYVEELKDDAVTKGAEIKYGERLSERYFKPYIVTSVTEDMRIAWEEPFGPIVPIMKFSELDEAISLANKSEYGLQSSIFTKDINTAFYAAGKLEVGTVQINGKDSRSPDHFPFTGSKKSGLGNVQGAKYLLEEVTRTKSIVLNF